MEDINCPLLGEGNMEHAKHEGVNIAVVVNISTNLSSFSLQIVSYI